MIQGLRISTVRASANIRSSKILQGLGKKEGRVANMHSLVDDTVTAQ